jgi:hypothetical protein
MQNLQELHAESENEIRLSYLFDISQTQRHPITISLIFAPDTRQLAMVNTEGVAELGIDVTDLVVSHVQLNDVHGVIAAILAQVRYSVGSKESPDR